MAGLPEIVAYPYPASPYCPHHDGGGAGESRRGESCNACMDARKNYNQQYPGTWEDGEKESYDTERDREYLEGIADIDDRARCPFCDENGWLLKPDDGTPLIRQYRKRDGTVTDPVGVLCAHMDDIPDVPAVAVDETLTRWGHE